MEEESLDKAATRKFLYLVIAGLVVFLGVSLFSPMFGGGPPSHPPRVNIFRINETVDVIWEGGIDESFVGNFSITINNETSYYPKPLLFQKVASLKIPNQSCIDVQAIDKATRIYRPIGYACL